MYKNGTCRNCEPLDGEIYQYFDDGHTEIMPETTTTESEEEFEMVELDKVPSDFDANQKEAMKVWVRMNDPFY